MMYAASNHSMTVADLQSVCAQMDNLLTRAHDLGASGTDNDEALVHTPPAGPPPKAARGC